LSDFDNIILVTGCARSGTSIVGGIINMCGAFGGQMSPGNRHNQKGMFENAVIRNHITKPYLRSLGVDPMGQWPLPNLENLLIPVDWRQRVEQVLLDQGFDGQQKVFYKGAKMCLFWPVWNYAFPKARWVIVRRRSGDIASSCEKTGFMSAFGRKDVQRAVGADNERDGWLFWINHHLSCFRAMQDAGLDVRVVWPERAVDGDFSEMKELIDWCRLDWNPDVLGFVDKKLWKARRK